MSATDDLLHNAAEYAARFDKGGLPLPPAKRVAVLACMDARLDPCGLLGLEEGDAHVIRNAGGLATDDAIRSLAFSQRMAGTTEIVLLHHTDCGMQTLSDEDFRRTLHDETGTEPGWEVETHSDLDASLRGSIARITASPFIPHKQSVRGFVYDVADGTLREVV